MSSERKDDHLRLAGDQSRLPRSGAGFDDIAFVHHALAGIDVADVDLTVRMPGGRWDAPLLINAMTGGSDATGRVNRELAVAARETGLAIASGSVSIALGDPSVAGTFRVLRDENPDGYVLANLGVERSPDDARRAVDLLQADALQVHVNAVQEIVMPEGSRSFARWPASLEAIVAAVDVPVVVKEVGFGLSADTLALLTDLGVAAADVAGRGGTDFVQIENARRPEGGYEHLFGWGQTAVACLLEAPADAPVLIASGGVRSPLDVVRALALGARAVGVSGGFLRTALDGGAEALVAQIREWQAHVAALCALLGAATPDDLLHTDVIVGGETADFCRARGVDLAPWAVRSRAHRAETARRERSRHDR
ncbi:type 2 isopentenyl-diphosphate Delta-isomerase [Microbacterium telephonicum]|uniref:Isopentenyl-diphosphate delta-isomerase n=1 Tax=Microbacterium telephonicum TaxID=1714841 RepID=A0A498BZN4_9MICO|nr:type 2 isopentenyl-diphosphate Delta-isomerase [Microbacterium telephonicum]RLK49194.1 isopentenyl-diphosphate delta-isomerase [Microbacterium telephonicum]